MANVFLSPSDHGVGKNVCLHSGCYEDKHTRKIAEACGGYLKNSGIRVKIGVANQSIAQRCKDSDDFDADLHVPIHTNAFSDPDTRYLMFMFYEDSEKYRKVFNAVAPALEEIYPEKKKSVFKVRKDLGEITRPAAITLYCELGFHTNRKDCDEFIHNADSVGKALAKGICDYFGVNCKETPEKKAPEGYTKTQFIKEVQAACGAAVDGIAGPETLSKTVTLSAVKNKKHPAVKPVQKWLFALGHTQVGGADGVAGPKFDAAVKSFQRENGCVVDGELTAGNKTWQKLLGL